MPFPGWNSAGTCPTTRAGVGSPRWNGTTFPAFVAPDTPLLDPAITWPPIANAIAVAAPATVMVSFRLLHNCLLVMMEPFARLVRDHGQPARTR